MSNDYTWGIKPKDVYGKEICDIAGYDITDFHPPKHKETFLTINGEIGFASDAFNASSPRLILVKKRLKVVKFIEDPKGKYQMINNLPQLCPLQPTCVAGPHFRLEESYE